MRTMFCLHRAAIRYTGHVNENLDFHTACVIYFCSNLCIAALLAVAFSDSRARGARLWIAGLVAQLASVPLFALRGVAPDSLSILGANVLFALSWTFYWASFDVFFGNRRPAWIYGLPVLLAAVIFGGLLHEVRARVVCGAGLFALQTLLIAARCWCGCGRFAATSFSCWPRAMSWRPCRACCAA